MSAALHAPAADDEDQVASARIAEVRAGATGIITVDLGQIARNWAALSAKVKPATCAAVVKADAYGLGAARVIPTLAKSGCGTFFIATPDEAELARKLAPDAVIYALDGLIGGAAAEAFHKLNVVPVLSTPEDIIAWAGLAKRYATVLPAAFHIDTGLNRLGLSARDTRRLATDNETLAFLAPCLIMSHLASADNPRDPKNRDQLLAFETLSALFPNVPRSLAASGGLMLGPAFHFDLVRPGYALYGGQAGETYSAPVKPTVTVTVRILAVTDVASGETVGYSATWRAKRPSRIATLAAGYADGVPRSASAPNGRPGGHVLIAGHLAPIVGRVSMDLITVDVTDLPSGVAAPGNCAKLIGDDITIEQAGFAADTIGYEILTRLGPRFTRLYLEDTV